ncbi:SRPBCC domain-containing protein [Frondihabitans cladoniiphilus]|uniref:SRPBCC family protein n=1 Tax=Frondihabitans cladoniiphilus TaxID=715785 RepID=A0ABP8VQK9_9MICO
MSDQTQQHAETTHERVGEQSLFHRREFEASPARVHLAHTDAAQFVQWMGPRGTTVRLDEFRPVSGGQFRYGVVASSDDSWDFRGSYHEVSPGLIVHTWQYVGEPDITLETLRFVDLEGGRSALEIVSTFTSKGACDAMAESDMGGGMDENFDRIDDLLAAGA